MINQQHLDEALEKGILSLEQVTALHELALQGLASQTHNTPETAASKTAYPPADEESFRFITSFNDIFVTLGLGLFLGALTYLSRTSSVGVVISPFNHLFVVIAAWLLALYFTGKRRMALPSIVLLLIFSGFTLWFFIDVFSFLMGLFETEKSVKYTESIRVSVVALFASLFTASAIYFHWRIFRVPITVAAGVSALIAFFISLIYVIVGKDMIEPVLKPVFFIAGVATFTLAMRFDASDVKRQTRRTDIAFWLHLLAAPMIVHPMVSDVVTRGDDLSLINSFLILGLFTLLGIIALLVDRRAILVSSLTYAGYALTVLIKTSGLGKDIVFPMTIFVLGAAILALSAGWTPLREMVLSRTPRAWEKYVPLAA
jgi:MFS family permease